MCFLHSAGLLHLFLLPQMRTEIFFCMLCLGTLMQIGRILLLLSINLQMLGVLCPFRRLYRADNCTKQWCLHFVKSNKP